MLVYCTQWQCIRWTSAYVLSRYSLTAKTPKPQNPLMKLSVKKNLMNRSFIFIFYKYLPFQILFI